MCLGTALVCSTTFVIWPGGTPYHGIAGQSVQQSTAEYHNQLAKACSFSTRSLLAFLTGLPDNFLVACLRLSPMTWLVSWLLYQSIWLVTLYIVSWLVTALLSPPLLPLQLVQLCGWASQWLVVVVNQHISFMQSTRVGPALCLSNTPNHVEVTVPLARLSRPTWAHVVW